MSRCYKFRGVDYELPFLRPGRGESVIAETEAIVNQPKNDDYRLYKKYREGTAGIFGPTPQHEPSEEPTLEHPEVDLRGTMHPISLPVRSSRSHHKYITSEHSNSMRQSPLKRWSNFFCGMKILWQNPSALKYAVFLTERRWITLQLIAVVNWYCYFSTGKIWKRIRRTSTVLNKYSNVLNI